MPKVVAGIVRGFSFSELYIKLLADKAISARGKSLSKMVCVRNPQLKLDIFLEYVI
jgi:hypothetical protein